MYEDWPVKPICQLCGENGANALAGEANMPGVTVHFSCWIERQSGQRKPRMGNG